MATVFLSLLALVLAVLPLQSFLITSFFSHQAREPWNDGAILLALVLGFFYFYCLSTGKKALNYSGVQILMVGIVVSLAVFLWPHAFLQLLPLGLLLLTLPFVFFLVSEYGTDTIFILCVGILCLHSFWGITQFLLQDDLGFSLLGETRLDPAAPGIAKFSWPLHQAKLVRAYGPYPHSNSFAGALLVGCVLVLYFSLQHRVLLKPHVVLAATLAGGILVSFSRSALLGTIVLVVVFWWFVRNQKVPLLMYRLQWQHFLVLLLLLITLIPLWVSRSFDPDSTALEERFRSLRWGWDIFVEHPYFGVGSSMYPSALYDFLEAHAIAYAPWEVGPLHSVPLLILAEWGIIAFLLLCAALVYYVRRLGNHAWLLVGLLPALLLDHYFVTQPPMVLWLVMLLVLVGVRRVSPAPSLLEQTETQQNFQ